MNFSVQCFDAYIGSLTSLKDKVPTHTYYFLDMFVFILFTFSKARYWMSLTLALFVLAMQIVQTLGGHNFTAPRRPYIWTCEHWVPMEQICTHLIKSQTKKRLESCVHVYITYYWRFFFKYGPCVLFELNKRYPPIPTCEWKLEVRFLFVLGGGGRIISPIHIMLSCCKLRLVFFSA